MNANKNLTKKSPAKDEIYFIGFDSGFGHVKSSKKQCFPAGVKLDSANSSITGTSNTLELNGIKYAFGTEVEQMIEDKSQNADMLIQLLACIAEDAVKKGIGKDPGSNGMPRKIKAALGIGMPLKYYGNKKLREAYIKYFSEKFKNNVFRYAGEVFDITFVYVKCYPQAYAVYKVNKSKLTDQEYIMIDIGANTIDSLKVVNGHPAEGSLFTFRKGVNHLLDEIRDELETEGIRLSRETLTDIIIHGRKIRHKRADFIQTVCISHADKFISEVIGTLKQKYDLSLPVIWIGGGYQFMKDYIKKDADIFTVEEFDTFANADAYEVLVRANYAKDLKRPA